MSEHAIDPSISRNEETWLLKCLFPQVLLCTQSCYTFCVKHIAYVRIPSHTVQSRVLTPVTNQKINFLSKGHSKYSKVPNNSATRLLIFKIFSYQDGLIWTYSLINIQIIFLPTCLLSTIFYFLSIFNAFCSLFQLQLLQ